MIEQDSDYALLTEIAVAYYDQEQTQEEIANDSPPINYIYRIVTLLS